MRTVASQITEAADILRGCRHPLVLTGAGLSVASGLAAYRSGPGAVWASFVEDWGTIARFRADPLTWWRTFWLRAHNDVVLHASDHHPNDGHHAVTALMKRVPGATLVTQNIDGLHRRAGVLESRLIEIHGRADRFTCSNDRCRRSNETVDGMDMSSMTAADAEVPECESCGAPLRPNVLLFDEHYHSHPSYRMREAELALHDADALLAIGTSFSVGITVMAVRHAVSKGLPLINVNLEHAGFDVEFLEITEKAELALPALVRAIG
jgi:NAD-dependent deacetylase